jgi:putative transposase
LTGSKKKLDCSVDVKRQLIEPGHPRISVRRQCALLGLSRTGLYYKPRRVSADNLRLMRLLDEQYTRTPYYGIRRMTAWLRTQGYQVNHKRVQRLLRLLGLEAIYQKPRLSQLVGGQQVYPYLLRGVNIERVDQVWSTDITYIRLLHGFVYLVAILDWFSRYVLAWEVSVTLDSDFCISALERALLHAQPEIFNSDQGAQFTSMAFTERLKARGIQISMDGRGRALDNIFVERLWRTLKYEEVYLHDYRSVPEAIHSLRRYFTFYNGERLHQALNYQTPEAVYRPLARIRDSRFPP